MKYSIQTVGYQKLSKDTNDNIRYFSFTKFKDNLNNNRQNKDLLFQSTLVDRFLNPHTCLHSNLYLVKLIIYHPLIDTRFYGLKIVILE